MSTSRSCRRRPIRDWFDTRIGRTIQSVAASKWFGQLEPRELHEIAPSLGITPEERDRIEKAGQGEGLLVTVVAGKARMLTHRDVSADGIDAAVDAWRRAAATMKPL